MLSDSRSAARIQTHTSTSTLTHTLWYLVVVVVLGLNFASLASAQVTTCTTGALPAGNGGDLIVTGPGTCTVNAGTYQYHNVNIILGGTLLFTDSQIDFWAESILVENSGSLIAGSPTSPIGTAGGLITFHLYGQDQGTSGSAQGIPCVTPVKGPIGPCGIPTSIWTSNVASQVDPTSCTQNALPGGVTDCFYQYMPLDYDGGGTTPGYFGYKVLGVSYGGTLQLFGKKGATYLPGLLPSSSGRSWARLNQNAAAGTTTLVLDRAVDWQPNDQVVVTTTDYLPRPFRANDHYNPSALPKPRPRLRSPRGWPTRTTARPTI